MSGLSASESATAGPGNPVQDGLNDTEVIRRLSAIIRAGMGRDPMVPGRQRDAIAEEVLSEVCSRALAAPDRYDPSRGTVLNWLGGFAWNVLRERRKARPIGSVALDPSEPDRSPPVPELVANRLDAEHLLSMLPPDARQLLVWDSEGWTASEIGTELNLTAATVRVRLHRARARARDLMGGTPTGGADHD
jgi:RNA polymerase sigma factor (sigma-70 family)